MARSAGFEPTTPAFGGLYSIQLSYERVPVIVARHGPFARAGRNRPLRAAIEYAGHTAAYFLPPLRGEGGMGVRACHDPCSRPGFLASATQHQSPP